VDELNGEWCIITNFHVALLALSACCSHCACRELLVVPLR
jgi:hypothetical protein